MKQHLCFSISKIFTLFFILSIFIPIRHNAQINGNNIELGKIITLNSEVLQEQRDIFVYLPVGYELTEEKYPVIYILDGRGNFAFSATTSNFLSRTQRMPRSIVVGIPNTDRNRDFTPVHEERTPTSGGADNFLEFIEKELIPYIDKNYRTHSYRTLFGHSLCGMFAIYTLFEKPEMFDSFIAVSPYLQYADQFVVDEVESILSERREFEKDLFITLGDEPTYIASIERIEKLLSDETENLVWEISKRESEDHNSVPLKSLYDGLEFIYSGWRLTNETIDDGFVAVKKHYSSLSNKYGFDVKPTELVVNAIGYRYLGNNDNENAFEAFKYNVKHYPNSANVYDSLGETFEKTGNMNAARDNYQLAVNNGGKSNDRNLEIYKKNLKRVSISK